MNSYKKKWLILRKWVVNSLQDCHDKANNINKLSLKSEHKIEAIASMKFLNIIAAKMLEIEELDKWTKKEGKKKSSPPA